MEPTPTLNTITTNTSHPILTTTTSTHQQHQHFIYHVQVTNYHVIQDASDIQVTALGGDEYSARVIGVDRDKDVAVLQVALALAGSDWGMRGCSVWMQ